jgi:hypothetical protein
MIANRRITASVLLVVGFLVSGSTCTQRISPVSSFCPQPIHPTPAAKKLLDSINAPPEVNHYFNLIRDEQKAIEKACPSIDFDRI